MRLAIRTSSGPILGSGRDGVRAWKGIPYAAPPVGALRFRPPAPPAPWTDERDATRVGPVAVQARQPMLSGVSDKTAMSEDCLSLNVFAPADAEGCPVVVWIHGGAFVMGSGSMPLYNGASFARRHGVVTVTINYRLGLFGLLYLGDLGGDPAGNVCLLDQIAALRWVQENIAAFGGDPTAVTVMGESAGGMSIAHLLAAPAARGLFHRAILQSGAGTLETPTRADATATAHRALAALGVTAAELPDVPAERILDVHAQMTAERGLAAFAPYVDGVTLPVAPIAAARAGTAMAVPLLCGTNRDEWKLFELLMPAATAALRPALERRFGAALPGMLARYRDLGDLVGDLVFRAPMHRLADAHAAPVYVYRFDVASPMFGAAHALELPFTWNQLDQPLAKMLLGGDTGPLQGLAERVHDTWAAFIRTGDPNGAGLPPWPRYAVPQRATLVIDAEPRVADDPNRAQRELWSHL